MSKLDKYTEKAVKDADFRRKVLEDANKAIKEEFGEEPEFKVTYHVTDSKHIVFTFPVDPTAVSGELSDDALEAVAGGEAEGGQKPGFELGTDPELPAVPMMDYACFPERFMMGQNKERGK